MNLLLKAVLFPFPSLPFRLVLTDVLFVTGDIVFALTFEVKVQLILVNSLLLHSLNLLLQTAILTLKLLLAALSFLHGLGQLAGLSAETPLLMIPFLRKAQFVLHFDNLVVKIVDCSLLKLVLLEKRCVLASIKVALNVFLGSGALS